MRAVGVHLVHHGIAELVESFLAGAQLRMGWAPSLSIGDSTRRRFASPSLWAFAIRAGLRGRERRLAGRRGRRCRCGTADRVQVTHHAGQPHWSAGYERRKPIGPVVITLCG